MCECLLIEGLHTYEMNDRYVPDFHWCWVCKGSDEVSLRILRKDEQEATKKAPYLLGILHIDITQTTIPTRVVLIDTTA